MPTAMKTKVEKSKRIQTAAVLFLVAASVPQTICKVLPKQLRGVNRSGTEFACTNYGFFDGPSDSASIKKMLEWKINTVRVPLNEDCWLGNGQHPAEYIGQNYKTAVVNYVKLLRENGMSVILDLHWSHGMFTGPGALCQDEDAKCQKPMPNSDSSPNFWKSVAKEFMSDAGVLFDLFNEPFPDMVIPDRNKAWACWLNGRDYCPGSEFHYQVAGMQTLVDAVRSTGATNVVLLGGINYSSEMYLFNQYAPRDPLNKMAASWHAYAMNPCNNSDCWQKNIGPVAEEYSVVVTETGEVDCTHIYIDELLPWLDQRQIGYTAWVWNNWSCDNIALIEDYDGTPTEYGVGFRNHLGRF